MVYISLLLQSSFQVKNKNADNRYNIAAWLFS